MSPVEIAIKVEKLDKIYRLYESPIDRLKEALSPVRKKYHRDHFALRNISFEIQKGDRVGIVGRNGAGKSTLLKILVGVLSPSLGHVTVVGKVSALLELGSSFNPDLSGMENIFFSGRLMGYTKKQMEERLEDILSFADIGDYVYQPVKTYSSGMFMRLAFSLATAVEPEILIIDEALSVGDAAFQIKCAERIKFIMESRNSTLLFVSHSDYSVRSLCNKALFLKEGRLVFFGQSDNVVALYNSDLQKSEPIISQNHNGLESKKEELSPPKTENNQEKQPEKTSSPSFSVQIESVHLRDENGADLLEVACGQAVCLTFNYQITGSFTEPISFVFNLYRKDGIYILGATTIMEGMPPFDPKPCGTVSIDFPNLNLLSGYYFWRVAINDKTGLTVLSEAKNVCQFKVRDKFQAVGVVNLERKWSVSYGAN